MLAAARLQSQTSFLKSLDRKDVSEGIAGLNQYSMRVNSSVESKPDLLSIEARAGHPYFRTCVKLFDPKYDSIRSVVVSLRCPAAMGLKKTGKVR